MLLATCFFSDEQVASKRAKGAAEQRVTLIVLQLFTSKRCCGRREDPTPKNLFLFLFEPICGAEYLPVFFCGCSSAAPSSKKSPNRAAPCTPHPAAAILVYD